MLTYEEYQAYGDNGEEEVKDASVHCWKDNCFNKLADSSQVYCSEHTLDKLECRKCGQEFKAEDNKQDICGNCYGQ